MKYKISQLALRTFLTVSVGIVALLWTSYTVIAATYTGSYTSSYTGSYTSSYTGTYTGSYTGSYTSGYTGSYGGGGDDDGGGGDDDIVYKDHQIVSVTRNDDGSTTMITMSTNGALPSFDSHTFPPGDGGGGGGGGGPRPIAQPTATLVAQINPDTTQHQDSVFIAPDDEITLVWNSTNSSSCTNNFGAPDGANGTFDITPGLSPGEDIVYEVSCILDTIGLNIRVVADLFSQIGIPVATSAITVQTPDIIANTFDISPRIVRSGETATFEWELELSDSLTLTADDDLTPYSYECAIQGATPDGVLYTFDAADNDGTGSLISRALTSKYINLLQCGTSISEETEVEVVPSVMEI